MSDEKCQNTYSVDGLPEPKEGDEASSLTFLGDSILEVDISIGQEEELLKSPVRNKPPINQSSPLTAGSPRRSPRLNKAQRLGGASSTPCSEGISRRSPRLVKTTQRRGGASSTPCSAGTLRDPKTQRSEGASSTSGSEGTTRRRSRPGVAIKGRGDYTGIRQRTVTAPTSGPEGIKIQISNPKATERDTSAPPPKKRLTEEMVQQARQERDKRAEKVAKSRECSVPGCASPTAKFLKPHAFNEHIPGIFQEELPADDNSVNTRRVKALEQAGRWLLGKPATLDELLAFLRIQRLLGTVSASQISGVQEKAMKGLCNHLHLDVPDSFSLATANSVGILVHWKVILLIVAVLNSEERQFWRTNFTESFESELLVDTSSSSQYPEVIDYHFHLDRTLAKLTMNYTSFNDLLAATEVDLPERTTVIGSVAVFCDPKTYPTRQALLDFERDMMVAIGFHPRHASFPTRRLEEGLNHLRALLEHPRVTALGEVGIDHTEPVKEWSNQIMLLERVLPLIKPHHVLVLHCRGMEGDCGTEAFLQLLLFVRKHVKQSQKIHLHCFTGNSYVVQQWLKVFPNTFFGFTNKMRTFNPSQVEALRLLGDDRLLLESDAPYFSMGRHHVSSPGHLYHAAKFMAQHKGLPIESVFKLTTTNARRLYWN